MLRSLYSGISGLKNHQVRMDTIGNNISNVNTTGYKSGRVNFQDALSQYYSNNAAIGQNQIGTGMKVSSINNNFTQGAMQATGRTLDLAIQGNGFFRVGTDRYTRDGIYYLKETATADTYNLVNSDGRILQGGGGANIQIAAAAGTTVGTLNIDSLGNISGTDSAGAALTVTNGQIALFTFKNPDGLKKEGGNLYSSTTASGTAVAGFASATNNNTINSGYLEMSNVDLSQEMVDMMVTQRGFQANARTITVSDTLLEELVNLKR